MVEGSSLFGISGEDRVIVFMLCAQITVRTEPL